jgi:L-threonylcarbamoyladenylate synthase
MAKLPTQVISYTEPAAIARGASLLAEGELVAAATETVYGLAADAHNEAAVKKIYETKGRPNNNPLICHILDKNMADSLVEVSPTAVRMMDAFWPGPLTLVLPAKSHNAVAPSVSAGLDTLAVRSPKHPAMRLLIEAFNGPIAAPSANLSGKLSPTSAEDVLENFEGKIKLIIDGGETDVGVESTIARVVGDSIDILRPGSITSEDIHLACGIMPSVYSGDNILAPGQLKSHYAPNASIRLNVEDRDSGEVHIGFGPIEGDISLSIAGDLEEAAHNLFKILRKADEIGDKIAVAPIPNKGVGIAINDRLTRAAAPRNSD